jgi:transposase
LDEHPFVHSVINPLLSHQAKKAKLRKVKTDAADADQLGEMFYKEEQEPYKKRGQYLMNLRYLTRQHESLTHMYVQAKLQFQAVLDQVFPKYHGVFGDLYAKVSLRFLSLYPTSQVVLAISEKDVMTHIQNLAGYVNPNYWTIEKAQKLMAAAERNPFKETAFPSHLISLELLIHLLLQYQDHLSKLDQSIEDLAQELWEYDLIQSIPGIGTKLAATILAIGKFTATRNQLLNAVLESSEQPYTKLFVVVCEAHAIKN